jgi:hypothetical protein
MRFWLMICCLFGSARAFASEPIVIGQGQGIVCATSAALNKALDNLAAQKTITLPVDGCELAPAGQIIEADDLLRRNQVTSGSGRVVLLSGNKGDVVYFAVSEGDDEPFWNVTPAAAATPIAPPAIPPKTYKIVSPDDVRASPSKWEGRDIEFKSVKIYWVDDNDVRVLTNSFVALFVINPTGSQKDLDFFKNNCDTVKSIDRKQCRAHVRFSYESYEIDNPSGLVKRTVLIADDADIRRP